MRRRSTFEQSTGHLATCAMFAWLLALAVAHSSHDHSGATVVNAPPTITAESDRQVWFHIPATGARPKFSLQCVAENADADGYTWYKDGEQLDVDGERVRWDRPRLSGTIVFQKPLVSDQGFYQCYVKNIFGTALSNKVHVQLGVLDHFARKPVRLVSVVEGNPLTLQCDRPHGEPQPSVFWLFRDTKQSFIIETITRPHITVDGDGNLQFSHVKAHDGRETLLYQCAATSPVLHGEYRAGDELRLNVTAAPLHPRPAQKLWFSPSYVRLKAGAQLRLTCIFSGLPLPSVQWAAENGDLPLDRIDTASDFGKTLIIDPILPEDEGVYICSAGGVSHRMRVEVTASPFWVAAPPADVNLAEGEDAVLRCDASGEPQPLIRWFVNGVPLDQARNNERRQVTNGGRLLHIYDLNHDMDTAVYQCNASNSLGYVFANAFVNVRAHAPRFRSATNQTLKLTTGASVDLDCVVEAAPAAKIVWVDSRDRQIHNSSRVQRLQNNTLRLIDMNFDHAGLYYCNVTNKYGINRARTKISVFEPTYFLSVPQPDQMTIEAKENFELTCEAKPDARLSVSYEWFRDGTLVGADNHYRFDDAHRLSIKSARGRHSGRYECVATTDVDELRSGMHLLVRDVPEKPEVTEMDCDERMRRAKLFWLASADNADPVSEYVLEVETGFGPGVWREALRADSSAERRFEAHVLLSPWVEYRLRVVAVNGRGRSAPGYAPNECATKPSYPYENPKNVSAEGNAPDNLVIYWQPMDKQDWNADEFRYVIRYRLAEQGDPWREFEVEDPLQDNTIIRDTPTFRKYVVQVTSKNAVGNSIMEPQNVVGYSGEAEPSDAPRLFRLADPDNINGSTVKFVWQHVDPRSVNGHFRGYRIQAWEADNAFHEKHVLHDVLIAPSEKSLSLTGFEPLHHYKAHIFCVNGRYDGPTSAAIEFIMKEGPPSRVRRVDVRAVGANTIVISWQIPNKQNGRIRGYHLVFSAAAHNATETFVPHSARHYVWAEAAPSTAYEVVVWASTAGGEGPPVTRAVRTFGLDKPGKPQMEVRVTAWHSAVVTWLPAAPPALPGAAFFVNVTVDGSSVWRRLPPLEPVRVPTHSLTLTHLLAEQEYLIKLTAVDGNRSTASELYHFRTQRAEPMHDYVAEGLTSAAWFIAIMCAVAVALLSVLVVCVCQRSRGGKYPVKKREMERGHTRSFDDEQRSFMEYHYGADYTGKEQQTT